MRHIAARPFVSATYVPDEQLAITVHGRAEIFELNDPEHPAASPGHARPLSAHGGEGFRDWVDSGDSYGSRIRTDKMFTFYMPAT